MRPWPMTLGARASYPALSILLAFGVAGCVTVSAQPAAPSDRPARVASAAGATAPPSSVREASPTVEPTVVAPSVIPVPGSVAPASTPITSPTPPPSPSPLPSPTAEVATASAGAPALDARTTAKLQRILTNRVRNKGVAGLQAAVRLPSGQTWVGTAGNAEFSPDRAVEDDTVFAIASITKTFVAALILQLVEEGKLDLDEPFGTWFTDAPRKRTVTLRQLLSHTSGIYNYFENPRYGKAAEAWWKNRRAGGLRARDHRWTYREIMDLVRSGYCKPGACYHYSNTNYVILGKVAEAVEGKPLHRQLRQRFFEPLGLKDTVYQPAEKPPADAAHGHWPSGSGHTDHTGGSRYVPFLAAASVADAAGAIASTARDLAVWADALYGGKVLSDASLAEMTTFLRPGLYGLGTDVALFAGNRGHGHRGGLRGFESSMWYFPESGVSVVLLSNQGNWLTDEPMEQLVRAVLGSK